MIKCEHDFVRSGHGKDLICTKCGYAAMQGQLAMPMQAPLLQPSAQPIMRETIEVPFYDGEKTVRVSVYKDELLREMRKEMGLTIGLGV